MATAKDNKISFSVQQLLANTYGPYAFGLLSVCVLWFIAVSPQLEAMRLDFKQNQNVVEQMRELNRNQMILAQTTQATARTLERTVDKLQSYGERINGD